MPESATKPRFDPTLFSLAALRDPAKFHVEHGVPLFDEHDEHDPKTGKLIRRFDRALLQEICNTANHREEVTGDFVGFGPGHTLQKIYDKDGRPVHIPREQDQPEWYGVFRNLRLGPFGPGGKLAIVADQYTRRDKMEDSLTYPKRSIELWMGRKEIDWVALKRASTERDLGLMNLSPVAVSQPAAAFERVSDGLLVYEMGGTSFAGAGVPILGGGSDPQTMEAKTMKELFERMDAMEKRLTDHPAWKHMCSQYEAHCKQYGMPSGTNVFVPGGTGEPMHNDRQPPAVTPAPQEDALRMQREQDAIRYGRLETELGSVKAENEKLRLEFQRRDREADLIQIQAEGFEFDRAKMLGDVVAMTPETYERKKEEIRTYYRKVSPIKRPGFIRLTEEHMEGQGSGDDGRQMSDEAFETCKLYQREHPTEAMSEIIDNVKRGRIRRGRDGGFIVVPSPTNGTPTN